MQLPSAPVLRLLQKRQEQKTRAGAHAELRAQRRALLQVYAWVCLRLVAMQVSWSRLQHAQKSFLHLQKIRSSQDLVLGGREAREALLE